MKPIAVCLPDAPDEQPAHSSRRTCDCWSVRLSSGAAPRAGNQNRNWSGAATLHGSRSLRGARNAMRSVRIRCLVTASILLLSVAHADEFGWRGGSSTSTARGPSGEARGGRRGRPGSWRHQPRCQSRSAITPAARSTTSAASRIMSSRKRRPTIWTPTGWPPFSSACTIAAGRPMKFMA